MRLDNTQIEAVLEMEPPKDKDTLQSFLGMVNYMKKYSKERTKLCYPFRDLVKTQSIYAWESQHQQAFERNNINTSPRLLRQIKEPCDSD